MSCSLAVGRAGMSLQNIDISRLGMSGNQITILGDLDGTAEVVETQVEQLLGHADSGDETFVPVVWDAPDSRLNGYYRVLGVDAETQLRRPSASSYPFRIELERVQDYASPRFESVIVGGKRASSNGALVTPRPWHGIPNTAVGYDVPIEVGAGDVLTGETGSIQIFSESPGGANYLFNGRPSWYLAPEDWYDAASTIFVNYKVVVGRRTLNLPLNWILSNGLVRIRPRTLGFGFHLERWVSGNWESRGIWEVGQLQGSSGSSFAFFPLPYAISILRNDPACATIRLSSQVASWGAGVRRRIAHTDLSLRRGSLTVAVTVSTQDTGQRIAFRSPISFASQVNGQDITADISSSIAACGTSNTVKSNESGYVQFVNPAGGFAQWGWGDYTTTDFIAQTWASAQSERTEVISV